MSLRHTWQWVPMDQSKHWNIWFIYKKLYIKCIKSLIHTFMWTGFWTFFSGFDTNFYKSENNYKEKCVYYRVLVQIGPNYNERGELTDFLMWKKGRTDNLNIHCPISLTRRLWRRVQRVLSKLLTHYWLVYVIKLLLSKFHLFWELVLHKR